MAIKVKITPSEGVSETVPSGNIKIKIISEDPKPVEVELVARRALNGDIMILDHDLVDIVISPGKKRVTTFPKKITEREVYPVQDRFYKFLRKKGIITGQSVLKIWRDFSYLLKNSF